MPYHTERWGGPELFYFARGGTRIFFSFVRGGPVFFYHGQRGGPEKIGDSSSQIDGPPILIKNGNSLTCQGKCSFHTNEKGFLSTLSCVACLTLYTERNMNNS